MKIFSYLYKACVVFTSVSLVNAQGVFNLFSRPRSTILLRNFPCFLQDYNGKHYTLAEFTSKNFPDNNIDYDSYEYLVQNPSLPFGAMNNLVCDGKISGFNSKKDCVKFGERVRREADDRFGLINSFFYKCLENDDLHYEL